MNPELSRDTKLPDFLSRLRGHIDIAGSDPPCDTNLIHRATLLRFKLLKKCPGVLGTDKKVRIDPGVVRAFLETPSYRHGARSLEAILDMCRLNDCTYFDPSRLPHKSQLDLHVDGRAFLTLASSTPLTQDQLLLIAKQIHNSYLKREKQKADFPSRDAHAPWNRLKDIYRNSNIEQAAFYPTLLAAAGCRVVSTNRAPKFKFTQKQLSILAEFEHERWVAERRNKQPFHPDMVPWKDLSREEREKDFDIIEGIGPAIAAAGLFIEPLG